MFIGHFAVGFAAKRAAPRASLGPLLAAPLLPDLLWPVFLLVGWEHARIEPGTTAFMPIVLESYPYSHSLLFAAGWAALLALLYWARTGYRAGSVVIALGVLSHWVLDAVTHRPDMPLYPGGPVVGLGLWNSVAGTIVVESLTFAAAVWLYLTTTKARDRIGRYACGAFVALLVLLYVASVLSPAPPSVRAVAVGGLATWLFPFWAGWFDRHREMVTPRSPGPPPSAR